MSMPTAELIAIIGSVLGSALGVGLALAVLIMRSTARVDADRRTLQAATDAYRSDRAAERRALQASMDTFRTEMMRLAERQTRLEAIQEIRARAQEAEDRRTEGATEPSPAGA